MYFIYSLLLTIGFLILLPRFLLDALHHGKYVAGFRERLGSLSPIPDNGGPVIWIHCVSVGETQAARPLVHGIRTRYPNHRLVVSTITMTGQNLAREVFTKDAAKVFYFPFDWQWSVRRALKAINPSAVLVMETELWPGFLRQCQRRQIPVALVNGRLSQQSFRRYQYIKSFMARVVSSLSLAMMQTNDDAGRLRALGMPAEKTFVCGSLKFDAGLSTSMKALTGQFRERFNLNDETPIVLAASTHAPEEQIILEALKKTSMRGVRLILAPRHPERFETVAAMVEAAGFRLTRRTSAPSAKDAESEVIMLDTIGELPSVYSLASVVFVGGSIANTGGHNILEPAATGACIVTGAHTFNFHSIVESFVNAGAIIQLDAMPDAEAATKLADVFSDLIDDPQKRKSLGETARGLVEQNRGATERSLDLLDSMLRGRLTVDPAKGYLRSHGVPTA